MVMADLSRALTANVTMDWMAVSSYGSGTKSSGVVRILKDLDRDITGRHVLVVEDIIDSGLTLSWLLRNLRSRGPESVEVFALLRKPDAAQVAGAGPVRRLRHPAASSSSATAWTTRSGTGTCRSWAPSPRTCTRAERPSGVPSKVPGRQVGRAGESRRRGPRGPETT